MQKTKTIRWPEWRIPFSLTPLTTVLRYRWKEWLPIVVAGGMVAAAIVAWNNGNWRLNLSPSEPMGIWSVTPITPETKLHVGNIVTLCPRLPSGYHYGWMMDKTHAANACSGGGTPFIKTIVAGPGNIVHETDNGVTINGHLLPDSQPLPFTTSKPQVRLPQWRGTITLKAGEYWAYGAGDPRFSFDSRYWGPFQRSQVRGVAHSVATWKFAWTPKVDN